MQTQELALKLGWAGPLVTLVADNPYIFLFLGLLVGGETVLLPAIYLALVGTLNVVHVVLIMVVATIISDAFWYALGRGLIPRIIQYFFQNRLQSYASRLHGAVKGRELVILFFSKFVYGTRIAAQVMCGVNNIPFWRYLVVNVTGVIALALGYVGIVYAAIALSVNVERLYDKIILFVSILIASLVAMHIGFRSIIYKNDLSRHPRI